MSEAGVVLLEKRCTKCDTVKPLSEFHRNKTAVDGRHAWCKPCSRQYQRERQAKAREEMGEEAWLVSRAAITRRHRERTGNATGKAYERARRAALEALRELHPNEFEHLFLLARRGELPPVT